MGLLKGLDTSKNEGATERRSISGMHRSVPCMRKTGKTFKNVIRGAKPESKITKESW